MIKGILFNTDMVQAILNECKTVTRRVIKPQPKMILSFNLAGYGYEKWSYPPPKAYELWGEKYKWPDSITKEDKSMLWTPPCHPGDILYVRETWCRYGKLDSNDHVIEGTEKYYYRADGENPTPYNDFLVQRPSWDEHRKNPLWCPSIHMPKAAARIWLKVTDVRVERLRDMTINDMLKEGIDRNGIITNDGPIAYRVINRFEELWNSTIDKGQLDRYGFAASPWVWVIEFERCEKPEEENND